jgi:hypothetical protein
MRGPLSVLYLYIVFVYCMSMWVCECVVFVYCICVSCVSYLCRIFTCFCRICVVCVSHLFFCISICIRVCILLCRIFVSYLFAVPKPLKPWSHSSCFYLVSSFWEMTKNSFKLLLGTTQNRFQAVSNCLRYVFKQSGDHHVFNLE